MHSGRYASLLLITAQPATAAQFALLLPKERFAPEYSVCTPREARHVLGEGRFDVVVIDDSVPADVSPVLADAAQENGTGHVLLLAGAEHYNAAAAFAEKRGFMTLPSPVDPALLRQSLGMMATASARIHELEEQTESLRDRMDEMRLVNQAKLILEKNAMDRCVKRRVIARSIIRTYQT